MSLISETSSGVPIYRGRHAGRSAAGRLSLAAKKAGLPLRHWIRSFWRPMLRLSASTTGRRIRIADLGAGCGAVSLLLAARLPLADWSAWNWIRPAADTLDRNSRLNQLTGRLQPYRAISVILPSGRLAPAPPASFVRPGGQQSALPASRHIPAIGQIAASEAGAAGAGRNGAEP